MIDRSKLNQLFKNLRKHGFVAKQNYLCCRGCAGAQLSSDALAWDQSKKDSLKGVVFYTRQDGEGLNTKPRRFQRYNRPQSLYLSYGPLELSSGSIGLPTLHVGNLLAQELRAVGLNYEWDGSENTRICIVDKAVGEV